jgi:hypothetical protein
MTSSRSTLSRAILLTATRGPLTLALIALAGCPLPPANCSQNLAFDYEAEFEACSLPLCGFSAATGSVSETTTLHPGEHGMLLTSGTTARVTFPSPQSLPRGSETMEIIARCDNGTTLSATEEFTTPVGPRRVAMPIATNAHWANYELTFFDSGTSNSGSTTTIEPDGLVLSVSGTGSCAVDSVHFRVNALTCRLTTRDAGFDGRRDARTDAPRDVASDASTDVPADSLPAAALFSTCASSVDCAPLGTTAACLTEFADGVCTRRCTTDSDCGDGSAAALCVNDICIPRCTPGDGRCDVFGASCVLTDANDPTRGSCRPSCFPTGGTPPSPTFHTCAGCNLYTGTCDGTDPAGAPNGDPCLQDSDCRGSFCIPESDSSSGAPTGFAGGYCASVGYRLDDGAYVRSSNIPRGNCPDGSAPYPFDGAGAGAATLCFATCDDSHPCRAGYECDRFPSTTDPNPYFADGFCLPASCATSSGAGCPSGYGCNLSRGGGTLCARF